MTTTTIADKIYEITGPIRNRPIVFVREGAKAITPQENDAFEKKLIDACDELDAFAARTDTDDSATYADFDVLFNSLFGIAERTTNAQVQDVLEAFDAAREMDKS